MQMMIKMSVCDLCVIGNKAWQHSNVGEVLVLRKKGGQKSQQAVVSPGRTLRVRNAGTAQGEGLGWGL